MAAIGVFILALLPCVACAPAAINLRDVQRIETEGRFVWNHPGGSPSVVKEPVVVEGERLQALLDAAKCRQGGSFWKGGIPVTLILRDGTRVHADGFSFYGGFLRIHRKQWCEFTEAAWTRLWEMPCREAVRREAMALATAARKDAPEFADGFDEFAKSPVVTKETLAKLAEVRTTVQNVAPNDQVDDLRAAAQITLAACKRIDTPE